MSYLLAGRLIVTLSAVVLVLSGCGEVKTYGPPFGIRISNRTRKEISSITVRDANGVKYDFGRIGRNSQAFRPLHLQSRDLSLMVRYATGEVENRSCRLDSSKHELVEMVMGDGYTNCDVLEPDPGDPLGPQVFFVANDTDDKASVSVKFRRGGGGMDSNIGAYSVECGAGPRIGDKKLIGRETADIIVHSNKGKSEEIRRQIKLRLGPNCPIMIIIQKNGHIVTSDGS
ncbi:MAG: hypothetical protein ABFD54_02650 [Armatimonadota bacterium]|nr:hypothetical protein [bacterium]